MDWAYKIHDIFEKRDIASSLFERVMDVESTWCVCGMGSMGRKVANSLSAKGKHVAAFIDAKAKDSETLDGISCFRKDAIPLELKELPVVIAIHNPHCDVVAARRELREAGFQNVYFLQNVVDFLPEISNFWLAPCRGAIHRDEAISGLDFFEEEFSRQIYTNVLSFRLLGENAPAAEFPQYFPRSLPRVPEPMRWIDCGSFNGDTLDEVENMGYKVKSCIAFEPDPKNFGMLRTKHSGKAMLVPCGLSKGYGQARFKIDGTSSKILSSDFSTDSCEFMIQVCALDDIVPSGDPINFIKMDIEGAELDALLGARRVISENQPRLAIASYHAPEHMYEIPAMLRSIGYCGEFFLRAHANNTFETVLYGLPQG